MRCSAPVLSLLFAPSVALGGPETSMTTPKESVGKIAVATTGAIAFNGAGTTLEKLRDQLAT